MKGYCIWLWSCGIREEFLFNKCVIFYHLYMYMCVGIFYVALSVSSPYLFVFGDDRVRGTREQVMMQVELVRLSYEKVMIMGYFSLFFAVLYLWTYC